VTIVSSFSVSGFGTISLHRSVRALMCAGVVPQHPPAIHAPMRIISSTSAANSSGSTSYTVLPFSVLGSPAFGVITKGREESFVIFSKIGFICFGPSPQFIPSASIRSPSNIATTTSGDAPVNILWLSSKTTVATTGRWEFSLAARTAAFNS